MVSEERKLITVLSALLTLALIVGGLPLHTQPLADRPPSTTSIWERSGPHPGLGRFPGEGTDYPLQYSGLENTSGQRSLAG